MPDDDRLVDTLRRQDGAYKRGLPRGRRSAPAQNTLAPAMAGPIDANDAKA
jgi:hypothetical protein